MTSTGRILVVDDERVARTLCKDALEGRGYAVGVAASGEEALQALSADEHDLLLADVFMPGMGGIELVREALARHPDLVAVAVTASDDLRVAVAAMQAGCADFLVKPVGEEALAAVAAKAVALGGVKRERKRLLDENQELVRSQSLLERCVGILGTLDLERLQEMILQVLARVTEAQGGAIWIADDKTLALRGYRGVVDRAALAPRVDPRAGALAAAFERPAPYPGRGSETGEAFYVPLLVEREPMGLALLADRARGRFGEAEHAAAVSVASFAAVAVRNARRFEAMERASLRDRETGAYNLAYFVDYAGKEFYKARRYGRSFSLAVISIDNLEELRRESGRDLLRAASRGLVGAVSRVVRDADLLARVSDGRYYVMLPETDHFGAHMFVRRASEEARREPALRALEARCPMVLSMGAATFPRDGEDFDELLHWSLARAEEQRTSLLRHLHLDGREPGDFWEMCDVLLAGGPLPAGGSTRLEPDPGFFAAVQREAAREIGRDPRARGLLYVGVREPVASAPVLSALPPVEGAAARAGDTSTRVYVLGPRGSAAGGAEAQHPLVTSVFLDGDKRLEGHEFLLHLSETAAYGLLRHPDGRVFHTSDAPLVDALVARLQAQYDLQPL